MRIRKNAMLVPADVRDRYINAIKALKSKVEASVPGGPNLSRYDQLVALHLAVTSRTREGGASGDGAHRGAGFLPWHRQYLMDYENGLRTQDSSVSLLYWDWADVAGTRDWLFTDDFVGPAGGAGGVVPSGPFSQAEGWNVVDRIHQMGANETSSSLGSALRRNRTLSMFSLPSRSTMDSAENLPSFNGGFLSRLEGQLHNTLHGWVGGTMSTMSSPNDPIFFMHHAAVDWMWARWQKNGHEGPSHYPEFGPRYGHGRNDAMWPWDANDPARSSGPAWLDPYLPPAAGHLTPADVLNFEAMGFTYDTLLPELVEGQPVTDVPLTEPGDEAGFQIHVSTPGRYHIATRGGIGRIVSLHGPNSWQLVAQESIPGGRSELVADLQAGSYFVVATHNQPAGQGRFTITLTAETAENPITVLPLGDAGVQAAIGAPGELDAFSLTIPAFGEYRVETEGPTDVVMSLLGPNDTSALVGEDDDSGMGRNSLIQANLSAGEYRVNVRHYRQMGTGMYRISAISVSAPGIPELRVDEAEVQDSISAANESDLYMFRVATAGRYVIETSGATDTFLTLLGPDNQSRVIDRDDDSGPDYNSRIEADLQPGTYYARVRHYHPRGTGDYGISVKTA